MIELQIKLIDSAFISYLFLLKRSNRNKKQLYVCQVDLNLNKIDLFLTSSNHHPSVQFVRLLVESVESCGKKWFGNRRPVEKIDPPEVYITPYGGRYLNFSKLLEMYCTEK